MGLNKYQLSKNNSEIDVLKIGSHGINGSFSGFKFQDADTKQFVLFIPSFDISAYGETMDKAHEMLKSSIEDCLKHLFELSVKERKKLLIDLGWKMNYFHHKEYSKAFIDANGELNGINAVENSLQRMTLTA